LLIIPLALWGQSGQIPLLLARVAGFVQAGNFASANQWLEKARTLAPNDPEVLAWEKKINEKLAEKVQEHRRRAEFFESNKDIPQAITEYRAIISVAPNDADARTRLQGLQEVAAKVQHMRHSGISAAPASGRSFDVQHLSTLSLMAKAKAAFRNGNLEMALEFVNQALEADPRLSEAKAMREEIVQRQELRDLVSGATSTTKSGDYRKAEGIYDRLLALQPEKAELWVMRGRARLRQEKFGLAQDDFYKALELKTPLPDIRSDILACKVGLREYLAAYSLSAGNADYRPIGVTSFRLWCFWKGNQLACVGFGILVVFFLVACGFAANNLGILLENGRLQILLKSAGAILRCRFGDPGREIETFRIAAKMLNIPWFHYVCGLLLLSRQCPDQAQEYLQSSLISPALSPRAFFFLGLARSNSKQRLSLYDFEQAMIQGLKTHSAPWIPGFVMRLEKDLLESASKRGFEDALFLCSYETIQCLVAAR
jgi:tetratricopeptide (TPR) repeat protein